MIAIYVLFLLTCIASLSLYNKKKMALHVGFGVCAGICFFSMIYFLTHMSQTQSFTLSSLFLFLPTFELTPLGNFFSFVIMFIGFASSIYAISYAKEYEKKANIGVFACLFNLFLLSMLLVISANNVFCFIVLWEIMTLVSAFLIMVNDAKSAGKSVMIYLGIAQIGAFCLVVALLIMGHYAGGYNFSDFANLKSNLTPLSTSIIFILLLIGFGSKAGMWPLHVWLPLAHPAAPSNISALMSGVMIKVGLFGLIKFCLYLPLSTYFGLAILILGAASSLFGVLYALCQHDYKALLAYHSVENIGIILLGLGTGFYGLAASNPALAAIGFVAGLYHVVNHAIFKALLFLCAGSVLHATHTRDMEVLGGLAKKMPITAIGMFVGIMGIAALPPVNGFVSEWLTYQGMLQGALEDGILTRYVFIFSVLALALTGVLVGMHLKLYAVIFAGTPRDKKIWDNAKESPVTMLAGIIILVIGCFGFGLGANSIVDKILESVAYMGVSYENVGGSSINSPFGSLISTPMIAIIMTSMMLLPVALMYFLKTNKTPPRETDPWACGFRYNSRMQMTASPFTGDLKKIMEWLFRAKPKVIAKDYFSPVEYDNHPKDIWWGLFYQPFIDKTMKVADKIGLFQNGFTNIYAGYILVYLCLILVFGYYFF